MTPFPARILRLVIAVQPVESRGHHSVSIVRTGEEVPAGGCAGGGGALKGDDSK